MTEETKEYVKYPTFDGKEENWPFFKKKMESYLTRSDLSELLTGTVNVLPDTDPATDAQDEVQKKNRKAAVCRPTVRTPIFLSSSKCTW